MGHYGTGHYSTTMASLKYPNYKLSRPSKLVGTNLIHYVS